MVHLFEKKKKNFLKAKTKSQLVKQETKQILAQINFNTKTASLPSNALIFFIYNSFDFILIRIPENTSSQSLVVEV